MAISECENCGNDYYWNWEDAFDKFGFGDGDGQVETWRVSAALEAVGYTVEQFEWGIHNTIISSIRKDGVELIPDCAVVGYDDPRGYLPSSVIRFLDRQFAQVKPCGKAGAAS